MSVKIFSAQQIKEIDAYTITHVPISSLELMERASLACVEAFRPHLSPLLQHPVHVFCGPGNNGGDGLAIARILLEKGYNVQVYLVPFKPVTPEGAANCDRLSCVKEIHHPEDLPELASRDVVIDALLGVGASRAPEGILKTTIEYINAGAAKVLSVDMPSGLPADTIPDHDCIVQAHFTATFQQPKLTFFLKETAHYAGEWTVKDIGLDKDETERQESPYRYLGALETERQVIPRKRFSHKGTYGHALLIAGSRGRMGAAVLSARAALRSGTGLLTVHTPIAGLDILQTAVPEAMCSIDAVEHHISRLPDNLAVFSAMAIGPGLGMEEYSLEALKQLLTLAEKPLVIDADALNMLAQHPGLLQHLPKNTILTPHPKEFERLYGASETSLDRLDRLRNAAKTSHCIIILKDAVTAIATPEGNIYFNTTGNPGMATGGSGDVLTGMLLGLLAQGYPAETAARMAVYFHGKAGDHAVIARGQTGLIAGDIIEHLRIEPPDA